MPYATRTKVAAQKTRSEIEALVMERRAKNFASFTEAKGAMIAFEMADRRIVFRLPLPKPDNEQDVRSRWRGLLLTLKAKFESIDRGIETFEDAFLAATMMPDGQTVADHVKPNIALAYKQGSMLPLLPPPERRPS